MEKETVIGRSDWKYADNIVMRSYLDACKAAASSDDNFSKFRTNKAYGVILEGGAKETGEAVIRRFRKLGAFNWLLNNLSDIKENDLYGGPKIYDFKHIPGTISSSSLQYALDAFNISNLLEKNNDAIRIVEVGAGFGGQARILCKLMNVKSYTIIDHPEACLLTEKYLQKYPECEGKIHFVDASNVDSFVEENPKIDLFVASASVAELSPERQNFYFNKLISKSSSSYLVYNTLHKPANFRLLENQIKKMLDRGTTLSFENPWFRIIFLYISSKSILNNNNRMAAERMGEYFHSLHFKTLRLIRAIRYKIFKQF